MTGRTVHRDVNICKWRSLVVVAMAWHLLTGVAQAAGVGDEWTGWHLLHVAGTHATTLVAVMWVFVVGACIGSFLNVVIYRLPLGMALSHPGSRCPECETDLTARDNIPILGWLMLRGRCRYCQVAISARYPLIEMVVGLLFLLLVLVETGTGATNLPLQTGPMIHGRVIDAIFVQGQWHLLALFVVHAYYLTVALAVCMIGYDGHPAPAQLVRPAILTACVLGALWPDMRPVSAIVPVPDVLTELHSVRWTLPQWLDGDILQVGITLQGMADAACGVASGLLTGWLAGLLVKSAIPLRSTVQAVFLLCGTFCGWQMTWPLLAVVLVVGAAARTIGRVSLLPMVVFIACTAFVLSWNQLLNGVVFIRHDGWRWTPWSARTDWALTIGALGLVAIGCSRAGGTNKELSDTSLSAVEDTSAEQQNS